jgi:DNA-directed RNA polymerases I and III subunit RPAC2
MNDHRNAVLPPSELFTMESCESDESNATFIFGNEDHTLGNVLRHTLMQREETTFCGYSVPHPYEPKMNVRLQTTEDSTALETLKKGLADLENATNILDEALDKATAEYDSSLAGKKEKKSKK